MAKRFIVVVGILVCAHLTASGQPQQSPRVQGADAKRLVGMWRLVSITQPDGSSEARGAHPVGIIVYHASGHMSAQVMTDPALRRRWVGAQPTPEEALAALREYVAYFGTYSVDERARRITHHQEGGLTPGALPDVVREYELLADDRVVLTQIDGNWNRLLWERIP